MADGPSGPHSTIHPPPAFLKRPRTAYDMLPSGMAPGHDTREYVDGDDEQERSLKDTKSLVSAYDRYLQSMQLPSYGPGEASNIAGVSIGRAIPIGEQPLMVRPGPIVPDMAPYGEGAGTGALLPLDPMAGQVRESIPLPPDASNTLYVEGLPSNCTKREVAHIFRPFVGYKEVRLVIKEPKHRGGDLIVLCFVDFVDAACAATALSTLQGYKMDEGDPDSPHLRIQFSRHPGPRSSSGGHRGRR